MYMRWSQQRLGSPFLSNLVQSWTLLSTMSTTEAGNGLAVPILHKLHTPYDILGSNWQRPAFSLHSLVQHHALSSTWYADEAGNGLTLLLPKQPCWTMEITVYAVHKGNSSKRACLPCPQQTRFFFSLFKLYSSSLWKEHPQWSWQHQGTSVQHCMKSKGHRATWRLTAVEMCSSIIIRYDGLATRWVFGRWRSKSTGNERLCFMERVLTERGGLFLLHLKVLNCHDHEDSLHQSATIQWPAMEPFQRVELVWAFANMRTPSWTDFGEQWWIIYLRFQFHSLDL